MMTPTYEQFRAALLFPMNRALIGLTIADADARALLDNDAWARQYFDQWLVSSQPKPVLPAAALSSYSSVPDLPASPHQDSAGLPLTSAAAAKPKRLRRAIFIAAGSLLALVVLVSCISATVRPSKPGPEVDSKPASVSPFTVAEQAYLDTMMSAYSGLTMAENVEAGADREGLIVAADKLLELADSSCDKDVLDSSFREGFVASVTGVTADQAVLMFDALVVYCHTE